MKDTLFSGGGLLLLMAIMANIRERSRNRRRKHAYRDISTVLRQKEVRDRG